MDTTQRSHRIGESADPIPAALRESLWLGGEALVACDFEDAAAPSRRNAEEAADPSWLAL